MISNYKVKVNDSCNYKVSITDIQNKYKFKLFCAGADLTDYYTKEQVDQSQNTQDILIDNLLNQIPTGTATGETINITDSSSLPLKDIQVAGNTYQETTTGKNLLPQDKYIASQTINGITYTNNGDGTFNLNGTATANTSLRIIDIGIFNLESGQRYYFYSSVAYNSTTFNMSIVTIESGTQQYLTANSNYTPSVIPTSSRLQFYIASGNTVNVQNVKLMLVKGADDTSYEPYTNGASPNPDYPQTISNVTGTNTIKINGKNLFDKNNVNILETFINASGVITSGNGNKTLYIACKSDTTYTISKTADNVFRAGTTDQLPSAGLSVNNKVANDTASTITITTGASAKYLVVFFKNASSTNTEQQLLDSIQIEQGSTATTYEAYKEKSYTINLGSIELCKIGDYKDRIYSLNGKWYLEKQIGKVVLDGTQDLYKVTTGTSGYSRYNIDIGTNVFTTDSATMVAPIYCNRLVGATRTNTYNRIEGIAPTTTSYSYRSFNLYIEAISQMTVEQANTWLSNNPTIVYYQYKTPTTEEITDATLVGQLDALLNSTTYKTTTNITIDTTNQKPTLTLTYRKDLETLIGG